MNDIIKAIKESNYHFFGIRHLADDENYEVDDLCRRSYDWNYEYDCSTYGTDEPQELPGTCAYSTGIDVAWDSDEEISEKLEKALLGSECYSGRPVIIAGDNYTYGNDEQEIIIENAVVIAAL